MDSLSNFFHLAFICFITLFPAVNPVGTAFIVDPLLSGLNRKERLSAAKWIALYSFSICLISIILGGWVLKLFGLSVPIVQIGGGFIICSMGWQLLSSKNENGKTPEQESQPEDKFKEVDAMLFYPITFPMTAGAGTISVLLTLSASSTNESLQTYLSDTGSIVLGAIMMVALLYICLANTNLLLKHIGQRGQQVVNRISAFLVLCVGLQIVWGGVQHLFHLP